MPPATPELTRRNRRERAWWAAISALLLFWLVASRVQRLEEIEATEADRLQVQVRAISQNLERQLDGIAAALRGLRTDLPEWQGADLPRRTTLRMQALRAAVPGVRGMALVDAQGLRVAAAQPEDVPDVPDVPAVTAWLQRLRALPDSSLLYVSPPFLTPQGARAVHLAVVLTGADRAFDGAILATLDGAYLETLLSSVLYAPDMTARIVHADLSLLVAMPPEARDDAVIAERVAEVFGRHLSSSQPVSVLRAASARGGERLAALRTLSLPRLGMDQPLLLGVGRSQRALRLPWRQQTELIAAAALGGLLASGLGLLTFQRRRSEREAAAAERLAQEHRDAERLRLALHGADLALWDLDVASGRSTVNERWSTMLGYRPDEPGASGSDWEALLHPDDRDRVLALQRDHLAGGSEHFEASYRLRHRDGHWVWVLDRGRVVQRDAAGRPLRMVGTHLDITERQQGELERGVLERQLREAQKIESIGTLAGGIAHDFNNILPAILGNVKLAQQDLQNLPPGHPALASLEQIRTAGLRARTLVQQILTFSRRQPQALVVQPLQAVIEETLSLLRTTLPAAVKLDTAVTPQTLLVEADATQLQQVVMNLCTNAWQALPEGRGRIEVGLEAAAGGTADGPQARLWVADNGSGMAPDVLGRIFDPFFTTKPVGQGTGLGLSVVHGIVRGLRGSISVRSTPGQGTRFDVLLPLAVAGVASVEGVEGVAAPAGGDGAVASAIAAKAGAAHASGPAPDPAAAGSGKRLLYVDDDEVMGLMVQRLLQREGHDVTGLVSPLQALALLRQDPAAFDLVISDFNMPEMSGTELAAQLRALRPALPVLISSGYISDDLRVQAAAQGVRALLQKEQTLEALPALVRQVLATA